VGAEPWTVGYASSGWTALRDHLRGHGYTDAELLDAGLVTITRRGNLVDVFHDRVTFPIRHKTSRDAAGHVIGFTARDLSGATLPSGEPVPKYLNTRTTAIYQKSDALYGLAEQFSADAPPAALLLVEGPSDVLALAGLPTENGSYAAVSPCGTAVTKGQIALLTRTVRPGTPIVVTFDADDAGERAADRAYGLLRGWQGPVEAIALHGAQHWDPADLVGLLGRRRAAEILDERRTPLLDLLVEHRLAHYRLDEIEGRLRALRSVGALLREVTYTVERDAPHIARIATHLAARLHLDGGTVANGIYPPETD
jgi:DNA primase catalytic core